MSPYLFLFFLLLYCVFKFMICLYVSVSEEDFSDADCLCVTVLTHGMGSNYLLARDHPYNIDQLWTPFTADRCLTLAGKPKLFFIQVC